MFVYFLFSSRRSQSFKAFCVSHLIFFNTKQIKTKTTQYKNKCNFHKKMYKNIQGQSSLLFAAYYIMCVKDKKFKTFISGQQVQSG